jgi:hypothetical protein
MPSSGFFLKKKPHCRLSANKFTLVLLYAHEKTADHVACRFVTYLIRKEGLAIYFPDLAGADWEFSSTE